MGARLWAGTALVALGVALAVHQLVPGPDGWTPREAIAGLAAPPVNPSSEAAPSDAEPPVPRRVAAQATAAAALAPSGISASVALEAFLARDYPAYWRHKAIAVGPEGVFATSFRHPDPAAATRAALVKCADKLRWHPNPAHRTARCTTIAVDDNLSLSPDPVRATAHARVELTWTGPKQAVPAHRTLLTISACGPDAEQPWHATWRDFFAASGVRMAHLALAAPPGAATACPRAGDAYDRFIRWNRARLEQALRQFAGANEQAPHPGVIWADAIAADVIHATGLDVQSAVITTNAACTLSLSRHSLLPATVRVTALVSLDDANLERIARNHARKGILDACDQAAAWRQSLHVVARKGKPRFPAWDPAIMKTLAAVAGVPPIRLEPDAPDRLLHLPFEAHRFFTKTFTLHSWHRAMVVSQQGRIFLAAGHARIEDAVQEALYRCRRAAGGNGFAAAPKTACILFAKDDEVVFRDS